MKNPPRNPNQLRIPALMVLGKISMCPIDPPRECNTYVYQRVKPGLGNVMSRPDRDLQLRIHVPTNSSATTAQLARRALFANAVAAWHALTPEQARFWRLRPNRRNLTPFNAFISEALKTI